MLKIDKVNKNSSDNACSDFKFIWGVLSKDSIAQNPSLFTLNDIDIVYDNLRKIYTLNLETVYKFNSKKNEVDYLKHLLTLFTSYMEENNLNINKTYELKNFPVLNFEATTISELYTNFRIAVEGYCTLYENR